MTWRRTPLAQARKALNPWCKNRLAQSSGANFEACIEHAAMRDDVMCMRNGLRAKWVKGRLVPMRTSLLDFLLVSPLGKIAMVDAKQFYVKRFGLSRLEGHQVALAIKMAARCADAGFVVHLAEADAVIYVDGRSLAKASTKSRAGFGPDDGIFLGTIKDFSLIPIWSQ